MDKQGAREAVVSAGKLLSEKGLVSRTWGNVSCRIDEVHMAITPSGTSYELLTPEKIVVVDITDLSYEGKIKPSSEKGIHAMVYRASPGVGFIIHTHQTYATAVSVAGADKLEMTAEEKKLLGEKIPCAAYGLPGSKKLMKNVTEVYSDKTPAVLLARHGALLTGADMEQAFKRASVLEDVCERDVVREGLADDIGSYVSASYGEEIPVMLDDYAQISDVNGAASPGEDMEAYRLLNEKNYIAYLHAKKYGTPKPIGFIDRRLMRFIYKHKYSKLKSK
jgi:L-ribulose-5-phosphate 4-epimerase